MTDRARPFDLARLEALMARETFSDDERADVRREIYAAYPMTQERCEKLIARAVRVTRERTVGEAQGSADSGQSAPDAASEGVG